MSKKTAIIGASENPNSYAFLAAMNLKSKSHDIVPLSIHEGEVANIKFQNLRVKPEIADIDTVTMYLNPSNQAEWENYILSLKPNRIIFNPGAENAPFANKAMKQGIETLNACTLVLLQTNQF